MIRDKYAVRLAPEQREELQNLIRVGKSSARVTAKAWILLRSDDLWAALPPAERTDQRFTNSCTGHRDVSWGRPMGSISYVTALVVRH